MLRLGAVSLVSNGLINSSNCAGGGPGGGTQVVDELNNYTGNVCISDTVSVGSDTCSSTVDLQAASTTQAGVVQLANNGDLTMLSGDLDTAQPILVTSNPSFEGLDLGYYNSGTHTGTAGSVKFTDGTNDNFSDTLVQGSSSAAGNQFLNIPVNTSCNGSVSSSCTLLIATASGNTPSGNLTVTNGTIDTNSAVSFTKITGITGTNSGSLTLGSTTGAFNIQGIGTSSFNSINGQSNSYSSIYIPGSNGSDYTNVGFVTANSALNYIFPATTPTGSTIASGSYGLCAYDTATSTTDGYCPSGVQSSGSLTNNQVAYISSGNLVTGTNFYDDGTHVGINVGSSASSSSFGANDSFMVNAAASPDTSAAIQLNSGSSSKVAVVIQGNGTPTADLLDIEANSMTSYLDQFTDNGSLKLDGAGSSLTLQGGVSSGDIVAAASSVSAGLTIQGSAGIGSGVNGGAVNINGGTSGGGLGVNGAINIGTSTIYPTSQINLGTSTVPTDVKGTLELDTLNSSGSKVLCQNTSDDQVATCTANALGVTLSNAYQGSGSSSASVPQIPLLSADGGVYIQDVNGNTLGNLFTVEGNNSGTPGPNYLQVSDSNGVSVYGNLTLSKSASQLVLQGESGAPTYTSTSGGDITTNSSNTGYNLNIQPYGQTTTGTAGSVYLQGAANSNSGSSANAGSVYINGGYAAYSGGTNANSNYGSIYLGQQYTKSISIGGSTTSSISLSTTAQGGATSGTTNLVGISGASPSTNGSSATINLQNVVFTFNASSGYTVNGVNFGTVSGLASNTYNGLYFGTGYSSILNYNNTSLINGSGLIQNAAFGTSVNYSSLVQVGPLSNGSIVSGFGSISTAQNIQTTSTVQGSSVTATATLSAGSGTTVGTLDVYDSSSGEVQIGNTQGSSAIIELPTTANLTAGGGECLQSGSGSTTTTADLAFGPCSGMHKKVINLTAEYAGAVLDSTGDTNCSTNNNVGTMTSGYAGDATPQTYYAWTSSLTTSQCYDIVVSVPIPSDFSGWSCSARWNKL